eukprot:scaffold24868_cov145-Skeletonema_dohrnii-CCMP3373.AAC.4
MMNVTPRKTVSKSHSRLEPAPDSAWQKITRFLFFGIANNTNLVHVHHGQDGCRNWPRAKICYGRTPTRESCL